jgi:hypothetical protein
MTDEPTANQVDAAILNMMKIAEIKAAVEKIERLGFEGDWEAVVAMREELWKAVLTAIRDGVPNAAEMAREALKAG